VSYKPLRIGLSPRFWHAVPERREFPRKTLQYLEASVAHWLMAQHALVFMIPSISGGGLLRRGNIRIADYVEALDGLVLQGGADVSPRTYGEEPLKKEWEGDGIRDRYEIDLLEEFVAAGKPVLGICRGSQLINVAFGGTLYQDIAALCPGALDHEHADAYDQHFHEISFVAGSGLARLYPDRGAARVNSLHHQAVKKLGKDMAAEALSTPDQIIEAVRWQGPSYVVGVQWHPEFVDPANTEVLQGDALLQEYLTAAERARG